MQPLLLATVDATAQGLESRPWPYFLALVIGALGVLWTAYVHASWAHAKRERDLFQQLHRQEKERAEELRRERNEARDETAKVRREHFDGLVALANTTRMVLELKAEAQRQADEVLQKRKRRTAEGGT